MTPTPAEVADTLERWLDGPLPSATAIGNIVRHHRALIVRALRALGEPDEAAVERMIDAGLDRYRELRGPDFMDWRDLPPDVKALTRSQFGEMMRAAFRSRAADE